MRSSTIHRILITAVGSCATLPASAQVGVEWERLHDHEGQAQVDGKALLGPVAGGQWFVAGHRFVDSPDLPSIQYYEDSPILQKLDSSGQLLWSRIVALPFGSVAGPVAIAGIPSGEVFWGYSSNAVALRRIASNGDLVWSTEGPAGSLAVVSDSLISLNGGNARLALVFGSGLGYATYDFDGVLQQTVLVPGAPTSSTKVGATDQATFRIAAAATHLTQPGLVFVVAPDGTLAWSDTSLDFQVTALAFGPGGTLAAAGVGATGFARMRLFDASGAQIADHTLPSANSRWNSVDFDLWGGPVVAGQAGSDASIASFTPLGAMNWQRTWIGPSGFEDRFDRVRAMSSGEFVAAGETDLNSEWPDYFLHRQELLVTGWRRNGDLAWQHRDPTTGTQIETCRALGETTLTGSVVSIGGRAMPAWVNYGHIPIGVHVLSLRPQASAFCFGDGSDPLSPCPCGNTSAPGNQEGCRNSTGRGARLTDAGLARLSNDTLSMTIEGVPSSAACLVYQAMTRGTVSFGDGIRCALAGNVTRLYTAQASGGTVTVPPPRGLSFSARSAAGGDPMSAGSSRWVQAYYRNSVVGFCDPATFNTSSALTLTWSQ